MRIYGSVQISFWENIAFQSLSDQAKLLAIYLLTGPHSNMLGCFRLPDGYITEDLGWNNQAAKKAFKELIQIGFLTRDDLLMWIVIHNFLKWNPIQNPRQGMGVQRLFDMVPTDSTVIQPLMQALLDYGKYLDERFLNCLQTHTKKIETLFKDCLADKEQNQDQEQDQNNKKTSMSSKQNFAKSSLEKSNAIEVLNFLNEKTGRAYRPVDSNLKLIVARLNSGATVMDCRQVIAKKTREWKPDPKMNVFLRPATLFNATKFEQYMGELVLPTETQDAHAAN